MDSEAASIRLAQLARIEKRELFTYIVDGWEDLLKRSLYGSLLAEVGEYPIVLALDNLTGIRGDAEGIFQSVLKSLTAHGLDDGKRLIAVTSDSPTVMLAVKRKIEAKFWWIIVSARETSTLS